MSTELIGFIIATVVSAVLCIFLGIYTYVRGQGNPVALSYVCMNAASAVYSFATAFELASHSLAEVVFWIKISYLGLPFIAPFCLIMCLEYAGLGRYIRGKKRLLPFIVPIVTVALHLTNEAHHLFYTSVTLREGVALPAVELGKGEWYIVHGAYTFGCVAAGVLLLFRHWSQSHWRYRMQIMMMAVGLIVPIGVSTLYLLGKTPNEMDVVPMSMSVSYLFEGIAIIAFGMFNLAPIATGIVFESMRDGMVVLDRDDRIIRFNPAAARMIPHLTGSSIGSRFDNMTAFPAANESRVSLVRDGETVCYEIRYSPVMQGKRSRIGTIAAIVDVTERTRMEEELRRLAAYDGLTQIWNRSHFLKERERTLELLRAEDTVAIIMLDIDHFKQINDNLGHEAGDRALQAVAALCRRQLGQEDLIGRYGGEELIICAPRAGLEQAFELAERIRAGIAAHPVVDRAGTFSVTASLGVAAGSAPLPIDRLIREADQALYRSKENGRNRVEAAAIVV